MNQQLCKTVLEIKILTYKSICKEQTKISIKVNLLKINLKFKIFLENLFLWENHKPNNNNKTIKMILYLKHPIFMKI